MSIDFEKEYQALAPFYRAFLSQRGHFEKQMELLLKIFSSHRIATGARILDAACGTGDVVFGLLNNGYANSYGIDASTTMLDQSQICEEESFKRLQMCRWQDLTRYFTNHGKFDFIFILGHALPHANRNDISDILNYIFNGLNADGIFCFDMRQWKRNDNGKLVQAERTAGEWKWIANLVFNGCQYKICEKCSYDAHRQYISYRIQNITGMDVEPEVDRRVEVSYELFDTDEANSWLEGAGFRKVQIQKYPEWPSYLTITAQK